MPKDLLSAHSVDGEAREPMTDEQMKETDTRVRALEDEMSTAIEVRPFWDQGKG
jgi:hypothetical protein